MFKVIDRFYCFIRVQPLFILFCFSGEFIKPGPGTCCVYRSYSWVTITVLSRTLLSTPFLCLFGGSGEPTCKGQRLVFVVSLGCFLVSWGRVSNWTWNLLFRPTGPLSPPYNTGLQAWPSMTVLFMCMLGDLNSRPWACRASVFNCWTISPAPVFGFCFLKLEQRAWRTWFC